MVAQCDLLVIAKFVVVAVANVIQAECNAAAAINNIYGHANMMATLIHLFIISEIFMIIISHDYYTLLSYI